MPPSTRPAAQVGGSFIPSSPSQPELTLSSLARLVQQQSDVVSSQAELISKLHESLRTLRDSSAEESESSRARIEALETRLRPLERLSQRTTALEAASDRMKDHVESLESQLANAVNQKKELERKINELDLRARVRETRRPDVNVLRSSAAANAGPSTSSQTLEQVRVADSRSARRTPESSSNDSPLRRARRGIENERMLLQAAQPDTAAQPSAVQQTAATLASTAQPHSTRLEVSASDITQTYGRSAAAEPASERSTAAQQHSLQSASFHNNEEQASDSGVATAGSSPQISSFSPSVFRSPAPGGVHAADAMDVDGSASCAATGPINLGLHFHPGPSAPHETSVFQTGQQLGLNRHGAGTSASDGPPVRVKMEPGSPPVIPAHEAVHAPSSSSQLPQEATSNDGTAASTETQDVQMSSALCDEAEAAQRFSDQGVQTAVAPSAATPSLEPVQQPAQTPVRPSPASRTVNAGRKRTFEGETAQSGSSGVASTLVDPVITASPLQMSGQARVKAESEDDEVSFVSEKRPVKSAKALRAEAIAPPIKLEPESSAARADSGTGATTLATHLSTSPAMRPSPPPVPLRVRDASNRAPPPRPTLDAASTAQTVPFHSRIHVRSPPVAQPAAAALPQRQHRNAQDTASQNSRAAQVPEAAAASTAAAHQARRASDSLGDSLVLSETRRTRTRNRSSRDNGEAEALLSETMLQPGEPSAGAPDESTATSHPAGGRFRSPVQLSGYASVPFQESLKRPDLCWTDVKIGLVDWRIGIDFSAQYNSIGPETLDCLQEQLGHTIATKKSRDLQVCDLEFKHFVFNATTGAPSAFRFTHRFRILPRLAVGLILLGGSHDEGACRTKKTSGRIGHFFLKTRSSTHFPLVLPDAPPPRQWIDYSLFKHHGARATSPAASASASSASFDSQSIVSGASTPPYPTAPLAQRLASTISAPLGPAERPPSAIAPAPASAASLLARLGPPEPKRRKP